MKYVLRRLEMDCFENGCDVVVLDKTSNMVTGIIEHPVYGNIDFALNIRGFITLYYETRATVYRNYDNFLLDLFNIA